MSVETSTAPKLTFAPQMVDKHAAARVPEHTRAAFIQTAHAMIATGDAQLKDFATKVKTGIYQGAAREFLAAQLREEAGQMLGVSATALTKGIAAQLAQQQAEAARPPAVDFHVAREIRDHLRGLPKAERANVVALANHPDVTGAVLHAPGDGFGLDISDDAKARLLANYNRAHRAGLLAQIAELEAIVYAVEQFRDTVSTELADKLK